MIKTKMGKTKIEGSVPVIMADLTIILASIRKHYDAFMLEDNVEQFIQECVELSKKATPDGVDG